jgi:hypothetical protein
MIESYSFGRIVVDGKTYSNDIKIIEDSVIPEWWRKSGHTVVAEDVTDLAASGAEYVVLGKGSPGNMQTVSEVRKLFKDRGMQLIEEKTSRAIDTFNRLRGEGKSVCAGFHLTC